MSFSVTVTQPSSCMLRTDEGLPLPCLMLWNVVRNCRLYLCPCVILLTHLVYLNKFKIFLPTFSKALFYRCVSLVLPCRPMWRDPSFQSELPVSAPTDLQLLQQPSCTETSKDWWCLNKMIYLYATVLNECNKCFIFRHKSVCFGFVFLTQQCHITALLWVSRSSCGF